MVATCNWQAGLDRAFGIERTALHWDPAAVSPLLLCTVLKTKKLMKCRGQDPNVIQPAGHLRGPLKSPQGTCQGEASSLGTASRRPSAVSLEATLGPARLPGLVTPISAAFESGSRSMLRASPAWRPAEGCDPSSSCRMSAN